MRLSTLVVLAVLGLVSCRKAVPPSPGVHDAAVSQSTVILSAPPSLTDSPSAMPSASTTKPLTGSFSEFTWTFDQTPVGPMSVVIVVPSEATRQNRMPLLITMHGQGEALKGPERGARGWVDDYELPRALDRLVSPPLTRRDLKGRSSVSRLALLNARLAAKPYRGLVVMCPYTPHLMLRGEEGFEKSKLLAKFFVDVLIPKAHSELPVLKGVSNTGIDGVSLGGRAALLVGLETPNAFGVVSTLQPAFDTKDAPRLASLAEKAREQNPQLRFRLLTSTDDYYLESTKAIASSMDERHVPHELDIVAGDHSYDFNRGPGVYEMLLFHDGALRGESWVRAASAD